MTRNELRAEWIRRLRSGDYKQGVGALHRRFLALFREPAHDAFCCLGVACHMLKDKGLLVGGQHDGEHTEIHYGPQGNSTETYLPAAAVELLGMVSSDGGSREDEYGEAMGAALAELNDNGVSFAVIADRLEEGIYWEESDA